MTTVADDPGVPRLLLTLPEAGVALGGISAKSVMRLIAAGELQACDVGTAKRPRTRVSVASLEAYVREHSRTAPQKPSGPTDTSPPTG